MEAAKVVQLHAHEEKPPRPANPVWDACEEVLGYGPLTDTEKRLWGKYTTSLRRAGATPDRIRSVAEWYRRKWPDIDLTITALEKWYSHFLRMGEAKKAHRCEACNLSFPSAAKLDDHMHNLHED